MKISVIIPSNNKKRCKEFVESFMSMENFSSNCEIIIIGNGSFTECTMLAIKYHVTFIYDDWKGDIIPFAKLRGLGMKIAKGDYFLFLDDDNRFPDGCDEYYSKTLCLLKDINCTTLQADRKRSYSGLSIQESGFFWTGYALFIKNNFKITDKMLSFIGCCEETLYSYEALNQDGLPFIFYGNPTYRDKTKPSKWNEENNESYSEEVIQENIQGYIQEKYQDKKWRYYNNIPNGDFPKTLKQKIEERKNG